MKTNLFLKLMSLVVLLGASTTGFAASVDLQWMPNSETDIAGYKVYYKADSAVPPLDGIGAVEGAAPIDVLDQTKATIDGLDPGRTYYFAVTAYNREGLESAYSDIIPKVPPLPDTTAPDILAFTIPTTSTTLIVPITAFTASDNVGVTGYLLTQSASTIPAVIDAGWTTTAPTSFTFSSEGSNYLYAWAKDAANNISNGIGRAITITLPDTTAPIVTGFTMPATASSLTVSVSSFIASDNKGVTGYLITESAATPAAGAAGWSTSAPTSFTFLSAGSNTAYAWAKDAAGNVSISSSAFIAITLPDTTAPVISAFTLPATATALTVTISSLIATDNIGVTGYMITEIAATPAAGAAGWTASIPTSFTFSAAGSKSAYAWAKDAAGNVSANRPAAVTITLPDSIAPVVSVFTLPATATSLTVSVTSFTATDNIGVTGYLITESTSVPTASASGWSASAPSSFTFSAAGSKTAYAWAKDAASNLSVAKSSSIQINILNTLPAVRIGGTTPIYLNPATLKNAYENAPDGAVIELQSGSLAETFTANINKSVIIKGGFNSDYSGNTGTTFINGPLKYQKGIVRMENVTIK